MRFAFSKIRAGGDEHVMNVEFAEGGVGPFAGGPRAVSVMICPATPDPFGFLFHRRRHHDVRRIGRVRTDGHERESAFEFFPRENHSGKIGTLQPLDETGDHLAIVLDHVEQDGPRIPGGNNLPALRRFAKSGRRVETGFPELTGKIDCSLDG